MTGRVRSRFYGTTIGTRTNIPYGITNSRSFDLGSQVSGDVVGNFTGDNPLHIETTRRWPSLVNGKVSVWPVYEYFGYPTDGQLTTRHYNLETAPSDTIAATTALSRTNPGRPDVSLPVFVAELREIPKALYDAGLGLNRTYVRNNSASGQFAWVPLYSDFFKLLRLVQYVEKRRKELQDLYDGGGSRTGLTTWANDQEHLLSDQWVHTLEGIIVADYRYHTHSKQWANCRWKPTTPGLRSGQDLVSQAYKSVLGWRISPADVWELLPWSWFIDYFTNVGDYLQGTDNSVAWVDGPVCVMTHTRTTGEMVTKSVPPGLSHVPGKLLYDIKTRVVVVPSFTVTAPLLTARQLTNLVGIAANLGLV